MFDPLIDRLTKRSQTRSERKLRAEVSTLREQLATTERLLEQEQDGHGREVARLIREHEWENDKLRDTADRQQAELDGYIGIIARLQAATQLAIPKDNEAAPSARQAIRHITGGAGDDE